MDMATYLSQIEYAASNTIDSIWADYKHIVELQGRKATSGAEMRQGYSQVEAILSDPDLGDEDGIATGLYWETYFGADKEHHEVSVKLKEKETLIQVRSFSTSSQSGTLLQYAKQGISLVHQAAFNANGTARGLAQCPQGRLIGSQPLRDVIWQGRNHAIHWEEGNPHPAVEACFNTLIADFGPSFADYRTRNLAFEIVQELDWRSYPKFRDDML